jgi:hypothetical protein
MKEEQEKIKKLVNGLEVKQKGMEEKLGIAEDWQSKNNLLTCGIDDTHMNRILTFKITRFL